MHYRFPMCAQESMVIISLSTVEFETDALGIMVREQLRLTISSETFIRKPQLQGELVRLK